MSAYQPPVDNLPLFNSEVFNLANANTAITVAYLKSNFVQYPNAQGILSLPGLIVTNTSTLSTVSAQTMNSTYSNVQSLVIGGSGSSVTFGIANPYNSGARLSEYSSTTDASSSQHVTFSSTAGALDINGFIILEYMYVQCYVASQPSYQTGFLQVFPARILAGMPSGAGSIYSISTNTINGNQNYIMTDATYAPSGRPYWSFNTSKCGLSVSTSPQISFSPEGVLQFSLYFYNQVTTTSANISSSIRMIDTSFLQNNGISVLITN